MNTESTAAYRWLKASHRDLDFWGIAGPLPWPAEDREAIHPEGDFPFVRLLEGIRRLRAAGREWKEEWGAVESFLERGNELGDAIESGDFATTLKVLDELEALRPGTPYCAFNRAFILRSQGDCTGALAAVEEATKRGPKLEHLWMRRGELHEELEQVKDAIFCFRKALGLLPNHREALEGLSRCGAMVKFTMHDASTGEANVQYFTPDEWQRTLELNVASHPPGHPLLRSLLGQMEHSRDGRAMLTVIDRMLEGEPPDRLRLRVRRADALRMLKRREEALRELKAILDEEPLHAEALYVRAWCAFDAKDNGTGWHFIEQTLESDPNHLRAIQDLFRHGSRLEDPMLAEEVADWAEQQRSWRGYWLASVQASTLDADASALRYAQAAYKLAPEERDALFLYANCLNNLDEGEHTAALVHPRLPEAKGDYQLKYVFAGAMKKLGLPEEAIRVLREALAEQSEMTSEWRGNCQHFLDELTGMLATGELELELHPNTLTLRRAIWVGDDQGPQVQLIPAGVAVPAGKPVRMQSPPGFKGTTGSVALYLHAHHTELEPVSLGWFRVHEIDQAAEERPLLMVQANERGKLEATARQGERRLPVTWSLYRVPSMETEGA